MTSDAHTLDTGNAPRGDPGINKAPTLRATWRLLQPFFTSKHRWLAAILVGLLVAESFIVTSVALQVNTWNGRWMDTLAAREYASLMPLLGTFALLVAIELTVYVVVAAVVLTVTDPFPTAVTVPMIIWPPPRVPNPPGPACVPVPC